ncbi:uncharacterized protein [Panulirus ornatus]|uniref:uncharacterized protein isoform X2 n=1 Tax=Panulirus ornatus TaxID=150431 RepID=UPI003A8C6547
MKEGPTNMAMNSNGTRRKRGRPRKKPKIEEEEQMSYEELQAKVQVLEEHNKKLTQLLSRSPMQPAVLQDEKLEKRKNIKNIACYPKRQVLLKIVYLRWDYQSCASHEEIQKTVEDKLLQALLRIGLIEAPETSKFHRFGKTNEGFNPFDQIVSIVLRSRLNSGLGVIPFERNGVTIKEEQIDEDVDNEDFAEYEIKYTELVNEVLPSDIRVVAWCPIKTGYSAKFDRPICTYRYFFPRGSLNIKMMNEAAQHLLGRHDYINLYKRDTVKGMNCLYRQIHSIKVTPSCCNQAEDGSRSFCDSIGHVRIHTQTENENEIETESDDDARENWSQDCGKSFHNKKHSSQVGVKRRKHARKRTVNSDGYDMYVITIKGQDFLWFEIRKIMAMLFHVGEGQGTPDAILELLDVKSTYRGQQLSVASDVPLNLSRSTFEGEKWQWDNKALQLVISRLQGLWSQQSVRATALRHTLWNFESCYVENTSNMKHKDSSSDLPHDQCKNLVGWEKVCVFSSYSRAPNNDHEYSSQKPVLSVLDSRNGEEADFNHTATILLIEFIRQRFKRFLLVHTRPLVYKEVQEELHSRGFSFTLENIRRKWNNLISTYRKIKEGNSEGLSANISWDYYKLLDDLLGINVLAVPTSESAEGEVSKHPVDFGHPQALKSVTSLKPVSAEKATTVTPVHLLQASPAVSSYCQTHPQVIESVTTLPLSNQSQTLLQSSAPITTLLHHDGDTIFATQTIPTNTGAEEKSLRNIPDITTVFLEYNLQQGEKRLDRINEHLQYMTKKAARKIEYRRRKEKREESNLKALRDIGKASEDMRNRLLDI